MKKMADIAAYMLENSIKAFETQDAELARATAARDEEVDKLFYAVWVEFDRNDGKRYEHHFQSHIFTFPDSLH
jgi:phosphate uptake regulator